MPPWLLWFRNQAARWVYCNHQTSRFSGLVHHQLLLGLDQCVVNPFPERMYRFGSSGWPTSNLLKRCGAPPALWRHCISPEPRPSELQKNTTMSEKSIHGCFDKSVMWNVFDIKYTVSRSWGSGGCLEFPSNSFVHTENGPSSSSIMEISSEGFGVVSLQTYGKLRGVKSHFLHK